MANPFRRRNQDHRRDHSRQQDWLYGRTTWRLMVDALLPPSQAEQITQLVGSRGWLAQRVHLSPSATRSLAWLRRSVPASHTLLDVHQQPFSAGLLPIAQAVCAERLCLGMTLQHFPWASLAALADGLDVREHQTIVGLTPARLDISTNQVELRTQGVHWPPSAMSVVVQLCEDMGGSLMQGRSGQLYLASDQLIDLVSPMPELVVGEHLPDHEPKGQQASLWRRSINALQMAVFEQSQADPQQAQTLWPWGVGSLPIVLPPPSESIDTRDTQHLPLHLNGLLQWLGRLGFSPRLSLQTSPVMDGLWQEQALVDWLHQWLVALESIDQDKVGGLILASPWSARFIERPSSAWTWRGVVDRTPWFRKTRTLEQVLSRLLQSLTVDELD
ncbi:MAG: hypothetical protein ACO21Q_00955 [Burkholderiaceae bacterium]